VTITAIIGIAILEVYAISKGLNGVVLAASCSAIAGLGGYYTKNTILSKRKPPDSKPPEPSET